MSLSKSITSKNVYEFVVGTAILLVSVSCSVIVCNNITKLVSPKQTTNILLIFGHLLLLIVFVLFVRHLLTKIITNPLILGSLLGLVGPIIGSTSLILGPMLGPLIKNI